MFSGIVQQIGRIEAIEKHDGALRLWISSTLKEVQTGDSVAVDGACLTVTHNRDGILQCEVSPETLRLTVASAYEVGRAVNLEQALRVGDRLGGHWVTGHVDTTLEVSQLEDKSEWIWMRFDGVHAKDRPLLMRKGSVCLNGVSLTVNEVGPSHFTVLMVPHTSANTNLNELRIGSPVNIEWDWMAKTVLEALQTRFSEKKEDDERHPVH